MICKNCNAQIPEGSAFCTVCGAQVEATAPEQVQPFEFYDEVNSQKKEITVEDLPEHLKPLSAWSYFWLQVLYAIPIVGFVFLIVFSFKKSNLNRRSFTRSYWCRYLIFAIIFTIVLILSFFLAGNVLAYRVPLS